MLLSFRIYVNIATRARVAKIEDDIQTGIYEVRHTFIPDGERDCLFQADTALHIWFDQQTTQRMVRVYYPD